MIEDDFADAKLIQLLQQKDQYLSSNIIWVKSIKEAGEQLEKTLFDLILLDLSLPDSEGGLKTISQVLAIEDNIPIIVLTGSHDHELGLQSVKAGAQDFLVKGTFSSELFSKSILYAMERHKMTRIIKEMALIDQVTGIYNRNGFLMMARQKLDLAKRRKFDLFIIFIDMDKMKEINDRYGHQEGDQALKDTATILLKTMRSSDMIGRLGGDEFAIVSAGIDVDRSVLKRIEENVTRFNQEHQRPYKISLSYGMTFSDNQEDQTVEELIDLADKQMYDHKRSKKNGVSHIREGFLSV